MTRSKNIIKNYLPFLLLLTVSAGVVFYQFLNIPKNTTFDEVEFAKLALKLDGQTYTPYSQYATGHATLYFYLILLSFKIFGTGLFALRLPSAIFGVLNPLLFYLIMKKVFNKNTILPFTAAFIFVTMRWYFNFARFGFEVTFLLTLEFASLFFALLFREKNKKIYLILSGLFAGLGYNSYQPGRVFFIIPLFILFLDILKKNHIPEKISAQLNRFSRIRTNLALTVKPLLFFLVPFFILILPLSIYLNIHKDTRFYQQFYPDNHEMTLEEKGQFFMRNLSSTAGIFHIKGDVNGRHNYPNKPALNPVLGVLFIAGLVLALIGIKDNINRMFLLWFAISLAPTLVTYPWENPNMLRTFTVLPSIAYFAVLAIERFIRLFRKPAYRTLAYACIIVLVIFSAYYEVKTYFLYQSLVFKEAFETTQDINTYLVAP